MFNGMFQTKTAKRALYLGVSTLTVLFFQNCSKASFSQADGASTNAPQGGHSANSCHDELIASKVPIKTMFVVDMSGSNYENADTGEAGSDRTRFMRGGAIRQYFKDYKAKPNFSWGFIGFQGTTAMAFINSGTITSAKFASAASSMDTALGMFDSLIDDDKTPYRAAIQMAKNAINLDASSSDTKYIVVFLSDGLPTDYANSSSGDSQLASDVQALVNIRPGKISFNTVYYGEVDADASGRLQMMSSAGGGQFLDTNNNPTGKSFYVSDSITLPGVTCN